MPPVVPIAVGVLFLTAGLVMALGDAKRILRVDRKTGHAIYVNVIKRGGSEEEAFAAAKKFYRWFGISFATAGVVIALVGVGMLAMGR